MALALFLGPQSHSIGLHVCYRASIIATVALYCNLGSGTSIPTWRSFYENCFGCIWSFVFPYECLEIFLVKNAFGIFVGSVLSV